MEDPTFLNQYETNSPDYSIEDHNFLSFSFKSYSSHPNFIPDHQNGTDQRPEKQPKNNHSNLNTCTNTNLTVTAPTASSFFSSHLISFDNSNSSPPTTSHDQHYGMHGTIPVKPEMGSYGELNLISEDDFVDPQTCLPKHRQGIKRAAIRSPLHAQEHVIAEKKRRENLSKRFIALSALLPSLKKINKASVLEEATKYVKHLQERMVILEEQAAKKTVQSVVLVRRTQYSSGDDDDKSYSDESFGRCSDRRLPEIEARFLDREVLIRIHCEKKKGCLAIILSEIETLDLTIVNSSILPFGNSTIDITVVSQMDVEFSMTVTDLVRILKQALLILV
ncbi:transcription factor bHLH19-like [Rosa rugosa]|uniref:transcription factor bHLH19-like n=1 Tax=Rosa rugosa TaxID=74645 RepID=UPI002B4174FC|nr:transcription factor bHLH19-like [Rosa rugosa]